MKKLQIIAILSIVCLGTRTVYSLPCHYEILGDFNGDCVVNFSDFAYFANSWLVDCIDDPNNPNCILLDIDGDGFDRPQDCNDNDPNINPAAVETCGDGIDNDCDDLIDVNCLSAGVIYLHYSDEFWSDLVSTQIINDVNLSGTWAFHSTIFRGVLKVPDSNNYQIRIEFAPRGELEFNGSLVGDPIGLAGHCIAINRDDNRTTSLTALDVTQSYPFEIRTRTGCSIYTHYIRLMWKKEGDSVFTLVPAQYLYHQE